MPNTVLSLTDVRFQWPNQSPLLDIPHWSVQAGSRVLLRGASGSGKSTLLSLLAGILLPDRGRILVNKVDLAQLSARERDAYRGAHIGYIFQQFNLLPWLSVLDNVLLPLRLNRERAREIQSPEREARRIMDSLGISTQAAMQQVTRLSLGEQQKVAVARAMIGKPAIILADEPTSALDHDFRMSFLEILLNECYLNGITLLFASHDLQLGQFFDYSVALAEINHSKPSGSQAIGRSV